MTSNVLSSKGGHRQAHAVHRHRSLANEERLQLPTGQRNSYPGRRFYTAHLFHRAHAVHMAQDEVAPQGAPEAKRALEVHAVAHAPVRRGLTRPGSPGQDRRRNRRAARATTVRQTPLMATLAPISLPSVVSAASTSSRADCRPRVTSRTAPTSSTMPVNIRRCGPATSASISRSEPDRADREGAETLSALQRKPEPGDGRGCLPVLPAAAGRRTPRSDPRRPASRNAP